MRLRDCTTVSDLASFLETSPKHLTYVCFSLPIDRFYRTFEIPKRAGGTREILAPKSPVLNWQRRIAEDLSLSYRRRNPVHGYVTGYSIITNAKEHVGKRWLLNVDLENFFPSITASRVYGLLRSPDFDLHPNVNNMVTRLVTVNGYLPIGAPSSPVISNAICASLDGDLLRLGKRHRLRYTRYADDLTFSSYRPEFPESVASLTELGAVPGPELTDLISSHGFRTNGSKVKLSSYNESQRVTGLVVNEKLNVDRKFIRNVRAMLHNIETRGMKASQERYRAALRGSKRREPNVLEALRGRIEFIGMVRGHQDRIYRHLLGRYELLQQPDRSIYESPQGEHGKFTVLHLSDFHFKKSQRHDFGPLLTKLAIRLSGLRPDLVVVTGDIAYSGSPEEYDIASDWFSNQLLPAVGLDSKAICFVPGNHDVDRGRVSSITKQLRRAPAEEREAALVSVLQDPDERNLLFRPFEAYREFLKGFGHVDELWYSRVFEISQRRVVVAGLCSSLLSYDDADESERLSLGSIPVADVTAKADADFRIAAFHHPDRYLSDHSSAFVDVRNWADLILVGHEHAETATGYVTSYGRTLVVSGGAAYQKSNLRNSVQFLEVDVPAGNLNLTVFEWTHRRLWEDRSSESVSIGVDNPAS